MEEINMKMTAGELIDCGKWKEFCDLNDINHYAINEGLIDEDDEFEITVEEAKSLNILNIIDDEDEDLESPNTAMKEKYIKPKEHIAIVGTGIVSEGNNGEYTIIIKNHLDWNDKIENNYRLINSNYKLFSDSPNLKAHEKFEHQIKLFKGRIDGNTINFKNLTYAEKFKEWLESRIIMNKLMEE
jgi:hypothetical protein